MPGVNQATQGRRGYYLYEYGPHLWFPEVQADFAAGMHPDLARQDIPQNGCYDLADFLLDRPGVVYKRGGSTYQNTGGNIVSTFGTVTYIAAVTEGYFPNGSFGVFTRPVAVTDLGDLVIFFTTTLGIGLWPGVVPIDKIKMFIGGSKNLLVVTDGTGASIPYVWDGTTAYRPLGGSSQTLTVTGTPTGGTITVSASELTAGTITVDTASLNFNSTNAQAKTALDAMANITGTFTVTGGPLPGTPLVITPSTTADFLYLIPATYNHLTGGSSPAAAFTWNTTATNCPAALYSTMHLSRIVLANTTANPNRIFFSPVPDPTVAWDATSYVDANNPVTGLAVVGGALLVFSRGVIEKYVGDVPPGVLNQSTLTHLTVAQVGTPDSRSITVSGGVCYFANYNGVWRTDGVTTQSLTDGKLSRYWRTTISTAATITSGMYGRRYLVVQALASNRSLLLSLVLDTFTGAWARITGNTAMMLDSSAHTSTDELYAASAAGPNVIKFGTMWAPASSNKNDANGTAVTPFLETRAFGSFPFMGRFGKAHLSYDMRDAASDNPTMAVTVAPGTEATTYAAVAESPLVETTDMTRTRFATGKESQALSVKFQQTNASSKTEIYSVEVATRGLTKNAGGQ